jgi:hypothetical protein
MLDEAASAAQPGGVAIPLGAWLMSTDATDRQQQIQQQQQKVGEFLRLLPLTAEIAGLPRAEPGKHFNEGQMEVRANTIRAAYKLARQIIVEIAK